MLVLKNACLMQPGNVFVVEETVSNGISNIKLGDFGLARILSPDSAFACTFVGTPFYMSPELFCGLPYNHSSDIWSLGCLVYELAALK